MKKKILIGLAAFFMLLLGFAMLVPILFKDDIQRAIQRQIAQYVNAEVFFDARRFSVSLFRDFPHLNARLDAFGVVNREPFAGDTLLSVGSLRLSIDLWSVLFGDEMKINSVQLIEPRIFARVNTEGAANWDIFLEQPADTLPSEEAPPLNIAIKDWRIKGGLIVYDDRSLPVYVRLEGVEHRGEGNLQADVFDMITQTQISNLSFIYDGVEYLGRKQLKADITLGMDLANSHYTFKQNRLQLNDFALQFEGSIAMPDTNIVMDLRYRTPETDFKTLLSLLPGIYNDSFKDLKASGKIQFEGDVKGRYNAVEMPGFHLLLLVQDGSMQYKGLPTAISNIQVDLKVNNDDGNLENTEVHLDRFYMDMGKNPIEARLRTKGLSRIDLDALAKARLDLAELSQIFPMPGMNLRGLFSLDVRARGVYAKESMPVVDANMSLKDGYIKTDELPSPLEKMQLQANLKSDGSLANSSFELKRFAMSFEGEPIEMSALIRNFEKVNFDITAKGKADLGKLTKLYPVEGMQISGLLDADLKALGNMDMIEKEAYEQLDFSGYARLSDFTYLTADMPKVTISRAAARVTPKSLIVEQLKGTAGKSDFELAGFVENYMAYTFRDGTLLGKMSMQSKRFDVNEWMSSEATPTEPAAASADTVDLNAIAIPKNLDFSFEARLDEVYYDQIVMRNAVGKIIIKDGTIRFDNLACQTLGGDLLLSGVYDTREPLKPAFDFSLKVVRMQIPEVFKSFVTVQKMAPLAAAMQGSFSTDFRLAGVLGNDLMPKLETLSGGGVVAILQAAVNDAPVTSGISSLTRMQGFVPVQLRDVLMKMKVENGKVIYEPFTVRSGERIMNISGSNGLDGTLDFVLGMDMPAGVAGQAVQNAVNQLIGTTALSGDRVQFDVLIGGTYEKPKIALRPRSSSGTQSVAEERKQQVQQEIEQQKQALEQVVQEKREEIQQQVQQETEKVKQEAEQRLREEAQKTKDKVRERLPVRLP